MIALINPHSGRYTSNVDKLILDALPDTKIHYITPWTEWETEQYLNKLLKTNEDLIIAGGDGTIGSILSKLKGWQGRLGILPTGTANDFAKEHGLPSDLTQAVQVIKKYSEKKVNLLDINDHYGSVFFGCGAPADIAHAIDQKRSNTEKNPSFLSRATYLKEVIKTILFKKKKLLHIQGEVDGIPFQEKCWGAIVMNIPTMGGYFQLTNNTETTSDNFAFVTILTAHPLKLAHLCQILCNKHNQSDYLKIITGSRGSMKVEKHHHYSIDGEVYKAEKEYKFRCLTGKLRLLT